MNGENITLTRIQLETMTLRILLLFLFCNVVSIYDCFSQYLEKRILAHSLSRFNIEEYTGNIKEIKHNHYDILDSPPPFDVSLLAYHEKTRSKSEYFFNRIGQITNHISRFTRHNSEEGRVVDYEYSQEFKYEKNRLVRIDHYKYDTLTYYEEIENKYDKKGRLIKLEQTHSQFNYKYKEEVDYYADYITSTIIYNDTSTNIYNFSYDKNWTLLSATTTDKENKLLSFSKYYYDNKGNLECNIYGQDNTYSNYYTGKYIEYKYDNRGILKRKKVFNLGGQSLEGEDKFHKRKLKSKTVYKEKRIDGLLIRRKTVIEIGKHRKKRSYTILDHKRNKILDYNERGGLNIYKIIYYD